MRGLLRRLDTYWFTEIPAERLAILRILVGAFALQYLGSRFGMFGTVAHNLSDLFAPVGLASLLPGPLPAVLFQFLVALTLFLNVAFLLGWRFRYTGPAFGGLLLFVLCYRNSWSMIYHSDNGLVLHALILGLARSADALSLDALQRKAPVRIDAGATGWPIRLICTVTVIAYFLAGLAKVTGPLGWSWFAGEALRGQLEIDGLRKEILGGGVASVVRSLYDQVWIFTAVGIGTLILELGAPLALFHKWVGRFWALGIWSMHWGIFFMMGIRFEYSLSGIIIAAFFPLERLNPALLPAQRLRNQPVVFFDGVCSLCNATVDFIIARDREGRFTFAPLQGEYAAKVLRPEQVTDLSTVVLVEGNEILTRSDAFLRIASHLGGAWRLAEILRIVPRPIRDAVYRVIAANRYQWFGKKASCRMPSAEERARFVA